MKADDAARRLTSIPSVGSLIAATVRATVQDPAAFRTGRDLAAWIGITPRAHSSGGKERLGRISKQGNKQLRTLLIVGATSVLKQARRGVKLPAWIVSLMARRPYKVAAVAWRTRSPARSGYFSSRAAPTRCRRSWRKHRQERFRRSAAGSSGKVHMRDEPEERNLDTDQTV